MYTACLPSVCVGPLAQHTCVAGCTELPAKLSRTVTCSITFTQISQS